MLSAAKHLCAHRDRPFAARRRDNTLPILVVKIHHRTSTHFPSLRLAFSGHATSLLYVYTPLKDEKPPSTGTTMPVTKAEAGLTSQSSVPTKSSGAPKRPAGVWLMIACPRGVSFPSASMSK